MAPIRALRTTLYGFMLAFGIIQTGLTITLALLTGAPTFGFNEIRGLDPNSHLNDYAWGLTGVAGASWIWMCVLIAFNSRTGTNHVLTTAFPHLVSVSIMSLCWLVFGILILTGIKSTCAEDVKWDDGGATCILTITTGSFTAALFLLALGASSIIYYTIRKSERNWWCRLHAQDGTPAIDDRAYGPMSGPTKIRTTLYSLILFFTLAENVAVVFTSLGASYRSAVRFGPFFTLVTFIFALASWIWTSVLLSYNRRPSSKHRLTRASAHFYSMVVMSVLWLAVGIMFSIETNFWCTYIPNYINGLPASRKPDYFTTVRGIDSIQCVLTIPNTAVGYFLFCLTSGTAFYIYRRTRMGAGQLHGQINVAQFDGDIVEAGEQREMVGANTSNASLASRVVSQHPPPVLPEPMA